MRRWAAAIAAATDALTACSPRDAWQRAELDRLLQDVVAESSAAGADEPRAVAAGAAVAARRPAAGPAEPGQLPHRTPDRLHARADALGAPPRRLPARPRRRRRSRGTARRTATTSSSGAPMVGDHDVRSEDRQLLLDALLAAGDHLVVTYSGRDERTNAAARRPSRSASCSTSSTRRRAPSTGPARRPRRDRAPAAAVRRPQLRAGSARVRHAVELRRSALATVRARSAAPRTERAVVRRRRSCRRSTTPVVELDDLVQFVQHPTKAFLRQRLGISLGEVDDELDDAIPIELDGLGSWGVGDRLLAARLARRRLDDGASTPSGRVACCRRASSASGSSTRSARSSRPSTPRRSPRSAPPRDAGRSTCASTSAPPVSSSARSPASTATTLVTATYSRVAAKHRIASWVRLLALCATAGRGAAAGGHRSDGGAAGGAPASPGSRRSPPDVAGVAPRHARRPLPARHARAAADLLQHVGGAGTSSDAARTEWETDRQFDKEDRDREHVFVLGERVPFAQLLADATAAGRGRSRLGDRRADPDRPLRHAAVGRPARGRGAGRAVTAPSPFDVCGPLPSGITLLEASAGTGKTFTIAALAARYVAEGTPLDQMLLVTFGRMATGELRARVRERLVSVEAGLQDAVARRRAGGRRRGARRSSPPCPPTSWSGAGSRRRRRSPTSTRRRSPRRTGSASRC